MSRTYRGNSNRDGRGKGGGYEYWSNRPGNFSGGQPGRGTKTSTHRIERREGQRELERAIEEMGCCGNDPIPTDRFGNAGLSQAIYDREYELEYLDYLTSDRGGYGTEQPWEPDPEALTPDELWPKG